MRSLLSQINREPGLPSPQGHLLRGRAPARQSTPCLTHRGVQACPAKTPTASTPARSICCCGHLTGGDHHGKFPHTSQEGLCGQECSPSMSPLRRKVDLGVLGGAAAGGEVGRALGWNADGWTRTFGSCCPCCRHPWPSLANE